MFHQFLPGEPSDVLKATVDWSIPWMLFLTVSMLVATFLGNRISIPFEPYFWVRFVGGIGMLGLAGFTLYYAVNLAATVDKDASRIDAVTLPLGVFWDLFPPMWFFTEYYAFDRDLVCPPNGTTKDDHLSSMRDYVGFASKVWAAVLALFLFSISQIAIS